MGVDAVLLHHLLGLLPGDGRRALVVDDIEFDRTAVDAAVFVDAIGRHLQTDDRGLAADWRPTPESGCSEPIL